MISNMNYITAVAIGLFVSSLVLLIGRLIGLPITGLLLAILLSALLTSLLYDPSSKKRNDHTTLRGTATSVIFTLLFAIMLTIYYIPKLGNLFSTADISLSVAVGIILVIALFGGIIIGAISGSIGSTFRDLYTVFVSEKSNK